MSCIHCLSQFVRLALDETRNRLGIGAGEVDNLGHRGTPVQHVHLKPLPQGFGGDGLGVLLEQAVDGAVGEFIAAPAGEEIAAGARVVGVASLLVGLQGFEGRFMQGDVALFLPVAGMGYTQESCRFER